MVEAAQRTKTTGPCVPPTPLRTHPGRDASASLRVSSFSRSFRPMKRIGDILTRNKTQVEVEDGTRYKQVTIRTNYKGVVLRGSQDGSTILTKNQFAVSEGQFIGALMRATARSASSRRNSKARLSPTTSSPSTSTKTRSSATFSMSSSSHPSSWKPASRPVAATPTASAWTRTSS